MNKHFIPCAIKIWLMYYIPCYIPSLDLLIFPIFTFLLILKLI